MLKQGIQGSLAVEIHNICIVSQRENAGVRQRLFLREQFLGPTHVVLGPGVPTVTAQAVNKNDTLLKCR